MTGLLARAASFVVEPTPPPSPERRSGRRPRGPRLGGRRAAVRRRARRSAPRPRARARRAGLSLGAPRRSRAPPPGPAAAAPPHRPPRWPARFARASGAPAALLRLRAPSARGPSAGLWSAGGARRLAARLAARDWRCAPQGGWSGSRCPRTPPRRRRVLGRLLGWLDAPIVTVLAGPRVGGARRARGRRTTWSSRSGRPRAGCFGGAAPRRWRRWRSRASTAGRCRAIRCPRRRRAGARGRGWRGSRRSPRGRGARSGAREAA